MLPLVRLCERAGRSEAQDDGLPLPREALRAEAIQLRGRLGRWRLKGQLAGLAARATPRLRQPEGRVDHEAAPGSRSHAALGLASQPPHPSRVVPSRRGFRWSGGSGRNLSGRQAPEHAHRGAQVTRFKPRRVELVASTYRPSKAKGEAQIALPQLPLEEAAPKLMEPVDIHQVDKPRRDSKTGCSWALSLMIPYKSASDSPAARASIRSWVTHLHPGCRHKIHGWAWWTPRSSRLDGSRSEGRTLGERLEVGQANPATGPQHTRAARGSYVGLLANLSRSLRIPRARRAPFSAYAWVVTPLRQQAGRLPAGPAEHLPRCRRVRSRATRLAGVSR